MGREVGRHEEARDVRVRPRLAPGGKDRVAPRGALGETAARPDPCHLGRAGAAVMGPSPTVMASGPRSCGIPVPAGSRDPADQHPASAGPRRRRGNGRWADATRNRPALAARSVRAGSTPEREADILEQQQQGRTEALALMAFVDSQAGHQGDGLVVAAGATAQPLGQVCDAHARHAPGVVGHNSWLNALGDDKHPGGASGMGLLAHLHQPGALLVGATAEA